MKTVIATVLALSVAAPAFANSTQAFFALSNDSAAETIVRETSVGDAQAAASMLALDNDSPAETNVVLNGEVTRDLSGVQAFFALGNNSAAERIVK